MVEEVKDPQVELDVTKRDDHRVGKETTNPSGVEKRPLILIGHAFSRLLAEKESKDVDLGTSHFADACDHISVLFQMLGVAFAFGGRDFIEKVRDLKEASEKFQTLPEVVDNDVQQGSVRVRGSHTRNLLRVKRGLELNRLMFQMLLDNSSASLSECATQAYDAVFAPYHSWAIRKMVTAGLYILPTKDQFLHRLCESDVSWREGAQAYVKNSGPIIEYVDNLFKSRKIDVDF